MVASYMPTLRKPFHNSTDWYKSFYNVFYLSQITNLTLLSYMDTVVKHQQQIILETKHEELLKRKIISKNTDSLTNEFIPYIINDEEALLSLDLEELIPKVIQHAIYDNYKKINQNLQSVGSQLNESLNKDISININELLKQTNTKNWYSLIKGFLNIWEFLFLYSSTENTLKQILNIQGKTNTEKLLSNLYQKYPNLEQSLVDNGYLTSKVNLNIWKLYTNLRDIYSHTHGILTLQAKGDLSSKAHNLRKSLDNIHFMNSSFLDIDNLFKTNSLKENKFYLLQDIELNLFRNFIIVLMENLDDLEIEDLG